jgi:hypothetical protein
LLAFYALFVHLKAEQVLKERVAFRSDSNSTGTITVPPPVWTLINSLPDEDRLYILDNMEFAGVVFPKPKEKITRDKYDYATTADRWVEYNLTNKPAMRQIEYSCECATCGDIYTDWKSMQRMKAVR